MKKVIDVFYWIFLLACSVLLCGLVIFKAEMFTDSTLFNIVIILPCICLIPYFIRKLILSIRGDNGQIDKEARITLVESFRRTVPMYPLMVLGVTIAMQFYGIGTILYEWIILSLFFIMIALLYIIKSR